jgi:proteasome lid subunit RPN8/RPN11
MWLSPEQARAIVDHARADAPNEACGLIAGRGQSERASEIIPIANIAADAVHQYHMDDVALVKAFMSLEARGLEVIGFYHSHPAGEPIPSRTDIAQATYPDTPYLIGGLKGGAKLATWTMRAGQVDEVPLHIGDESPPVPVNAASSGAQKTAILVSAVIAFILLIVVSLSLLPPAPAH